MNNIWLFMIVGGIIVAAFNPAVDVAVVTESLFDASEQAVLLCLSLAGLLAFWSGIMRIAQEAGVMQLLGKAIAPLVRRLFPQIPRDHPALGAMMLAIGANILGLGNAATPLGLEAMQQLRTLSPNSSVANDSMCTFLSLQTAGITLLPTTVISIRAAQGSANPTAILMTTLLATVVSTTIALLLDRMLRTKTAVPPRSGA